MKKRTTLFCVLAVFAVLTLIYSRNILFSSSDTFVTRHLGTDLYGYFRMVREHIEWLQQGFVGIGNFWSPRGGGYPADTLEQIITPSNLVLMGLYSATRNFLVTLKIFDPLIYFFTLLASYWYGTVLFKKTVPAVVLAVAYSFSLYGLGQLDHLDVMSAMIFVPLVAGFLELALSTCKNKYIVLTVVMLFLILSSQLYPFYFTVVFVCLRIVWELIRSPQRLKTLIAVAKIVGLLAVAALPSFIAQLSIAPPQSVRETLNQGLYDYAQAPGLYLFRSTFSYFVTEASVLYLGISVVVLALVPMIFKNAKGYVFYLIATLFFLLYSVGHYSPINLAQLVHDYAPFAFFMRVPARALIIGCLTLAVCAGMGFELLTDRLKKNWQKCVLTGVVVAVIFFDLTIGYELPTTPMVATNNSAYEWIAQQEGDFRILEIPSVYGQMNMTSLYTGHDTISEFVWGHGYYDALNAPADLYDSYINETVTAETASIYAIKYVVLNLDFTYYAKMDEALNEVDGPTLEKVTEVEQWLRESNDYKEVYNQNCFVIFENLKFQGFVYGSGIVSYEQKDPNTLVIDVSTSEPTTIFISQSYDRRWKTNVGTLSGQDSETLLAVPAGTYTVTLHYAEYEKSLLRFLIYLPLIGVMIWMWRRKKS